MARRRTNSISGQFIGHLVEMIKSPAFGELSLSAHRILSRIEIEHADHGGVENGKLPVTYGDFVAFGIHRHAISPGIRELVALGFLEVAERGRAGNAEYRKASVYRLTYLNTSNAAPTHDWRSIKTSEAAHTLAKFARRSGGGRRNQNTRRRSAPSINPDVALCRD